MAYQGLQRDRPGRSPARSRRASSRRPRPSCPGRIPEVTVSYVLKRPWLPGLPWSVVFRTEPPGSVVPPMVLVAHHRAVPLSVDDGQIVAHFPAGRDGAQFRIRTPLNLSQHGIRVFPDPNVEPDALIPIRLRHPESGSHARLKRRPRRSADPSLRSRIPVLLRILLSYKNLSLTASSDRRAAPTSIHFVANRLVLRWHKA